MYRVRLQYDVLQWAYYKRCSALQKHTPPDFQVDIGAWHPCVMVDPWPEGVRYDLVLQLVPDHTNLRKQLVRIGQPDTIIVAGLNVGYGHHEERLRMCNGDADHIVVNNRDCWERLGRPKGMTWISNGVDMDTFKVTVPIEDRPFRVLWTGCDFHCRKTNIKGWDEVLVPLGEKLKAAGIDYEYRRVKSEHPEQCYTTGQMVDWYNTGTVLLCTSSSEGTPNPALEAAACGCTLVTTPVGNMPELVEDGVNGFFCERDADSVFDGILRAQDRYLRMAEEMQATIAGWDWRNRAEQYFDLFRRLIRQRASAGA